MVTGHFCAAVITDLQVATEGRRTAVLDDIEGLERLLGAIARGETRVIARNLIERSPLISKVVETLTEDILTLSLKPLSPTGPSEATVAKPR